MSKAVTNFGRYNKYGVAPKIRRIYKGVVYASLAQAIRAAELDILIQIGDIRSWEPEPVFALGCPENKYKADFGVVNSDGSEHVEEVKGAETPAWKKNKRLWKKYGKLPLKILKRRGNRWQTSWLIPESLE